MGMAWARQKHGCYQRIWCGSGFGSLEMGSNLLIYAQGLRHIIAVSRAPDLTWSIIISTYPFKLNNWSICMGYKGGLSSLIKRVVNCYTEKGHPHHDAWAIYCTIHQLLKLCTGIRLCMYVLCSLVLVWPKSKFFLGGDFPSKKVSHFRATRAQCILVLAEMDEERTSYRLNCSTKTTLSCTLEYQQTHSIIHQRAATNQFFSFRNFSVFCPSCYE